MKKILFFEHLNTFWLIYALCFGRKYDDTVCAGVTPIAAAIRRLLSLNLCRDLIFSEFEGSYFDAQEEGYQYGIDVLYNKYSDNSYFRFIFKLIPDPLLECALKKELMNRYTWKRIRAFTFIKYLAGDCEVCFIPVDGEDPASFISPDFLAECRFNLPRLTFTFYRIISGFSRYIWHFCFVLALIPVSILFLRNGLASQKKRAHFQFAFDTYNTGIYWQKGYHEFFLYDKEQFHPSLILHVIRNRLENSKQGHQARNFFDRYDIQYVEMDSIPVSLNFFIRRVIGDFVIIGLFSFIGGLFNKKNRSFCVMPALAVSRTILLTELLYESYNIDAFIVRDEYAPNHVVRTAVAHKYKSCTIGFSHGDYSIHEIAWGYLCFDRFLLWGNYYKNLLQKSLVYTPTKIIGAGIYGLDKTYQWIQEEKIPYKYRKIVGRDKIVLLCGSSFNPDAFITQELTIRFYRDVIDILSSHRNISTIIKPKGSEFQDIADFQHLVDEKSGIIVDNDTWIYRLIPIADLVICINATSIGIEALMAKKKVLYYDVTGNYMYHPYARYDERLVSYDPQSLEQNIDFLLKGGSYISEDLIDQICRDHGYQFDGRVTDRFKVECRKIAEECRCRR